MDIADFSLDLFSLAGRNALVTGGNTDLGRAFSVAWPRPALTYSRSWFENLNWGQDKIDAEKADMLAHARLGYTTEVSVTGRGLRICSSL